MSEIEMAVEALKLCVGAEAFDKAMEQVEGVAPPKQGKSRNRKDVIEELLLESGMPASIKGFRYSVTAVELILDMPGAMVTKVIYPETGRIHGTTDVRAERAIRSAVEVVFDRGDPDVLKGFFGNSISRNKGKATNSEFLFRMAYLARKRLEE